MGLNLYEQFTDKGYVLLKSLVPEPLCELVTLTSYISSARNYKGDSDVVIGDSVDSYGTPHGDALLLMVKDALENNGLPALLPTYSFYRTYTKGSVLTEHTDRPSCNISVTVALSQNDWSFDCVGFDGVKRSVNMDRGDGILYYGQAVPHSRETPLDEEVSHHIFLHYTTDIPENQQYKFDGREQLGVEKNDENLQDV